MAKKSDLVLLFELAAGQAIEDYLRDRMHDRRWTWAAIAEEMNGIVRDSKLLADPVMRAELFSVKNSNLARWCACLGLESKVKPGRKRKGGPENEPDR